MSALTRHQLHLLLARLRADDEMTTDNSGEINFRLKTDEEIAKDRIEAEALDKYLRSDEYKAKCETERLERDKRAKVVQEQKQERERRLFEKRKEALKTMPQSHLILCLLYCIRKLEREDLYDYDVDEKNIFGNEECEK